MSEFSERVDKLFKHGEAKRFEKAFGYKGNIIAQIRGGHKGDELLIDISNMAKFKELHPGWIAFGLPPSRKLTEDEADFIEKWSTLSPSQRKKILDLIKELMPPNPDMPIKNPESGRKVGGCKTALNAF